MSLKKRKKMNQNEFFKPGLIFQIHNPLNHKSNVNQKAQFNIKI